MPLVLSSDVTSLLTMHTIMILGYLSIYLLVAPDQCRDFVHVISSELIIRGYVSGIYLLVAPDRFRDFAHVLSSELVRVFEKVLRLDFVSHKRRGCRESTGDQ